MDKKINIAIDGPSAAGKSTTAKILADKLNYKYLDTGAMYRAVGLYMFENNITLDSFKEEILENILINFNEKNIIELNGIEVENKIRTSEIAKYGSDFSKLPSIRNFLGNLQKKLISEKGYVAEGRDIGTVIIPDAEVKIYLTASVESRAKRRLKDFKEKGIESVLETIKKEIEERDYQDMNRNTSPLKQAEDAILLDNSNLTIEEQVNKILKIINSKI